MIAEAGEVNWITVFETVRIKRSDGRVLWQLGKCSPRHLEQERRSPGAKIGEGQNLNGVVGGLMHGKLKWFAHAVFVFSRPL